MSYAGHQLRADRRTREILVRNEETLEPPPPSRSRSHSASSHRNIRYRLYEKEAEANLLNFVDFLSEQDVNVERNIPLNDAKLVGFGSTMEVYSTTWKGQQVALKRMRRDRMPNRSANLPYEHDTAFAIATREFYNDVKSIMQEILVMSREPLSTHRNIVHLLAVSWDIDEEYWAISLFPPLMVVELANTDTPTLHAFYMNRSVSKSFSTDVGFIADIADGLSALHMCGINHGDLKPQNILLFNDSEITGGLIAKIADFGFANVEFLNESIRGGSEEWAAPECIRGCPEEIMTAMQELDSAEFASDIYSFGLVAMFVALDGVQSLAIQEFGPPDTIPVDREKAMRELKFTDQAKTKVENQVCTFYQELNGQESESAKGLCECYVSLIGDTLQSIPPKRVISLNGMRLRLTGRDQFARQRKLDKFKVRPFADAFKSSSNLRNPFTKPRIPFNNTKVLASLPDRVGAELRSIIGKTPEFGEPQLHRQRRHVLSKYYSMGSNMEVPAVDYENVKVDTEGIGNMISSARDWFDMFATLGNGLFTSPHAELDILDLDSAMRPQLFTLIDCNLIKEARKLLQANPSLVDEVEPETGWYPIHLAACKGRTEFLRMFISDFRANPNIRSKFSQSTPLHQAVIGRKIEAVKALLDMGAYVDTKLSANEGGQQYTALELAMNQFPGMRPSQDDMDVIRVLLQGGADYLRNFNGYPIIYSAAGRHIDLLKLFFDCIGPEDSRLVVDYRDSRKETMLHAAVMNARFDVVKLLLELGADPGSRDVNGQTAYVKLLTWTLAQDTPYIAPIQGLMAIVNKKKSNLADANKVLALLEDIGGNASAVEDEYFTKDDVEEAHLNVKSAPRLGKIYNPIQIANTHFQISRYLDSNSPCVSNLRPLNGRHLLIKFASSLATWASNRKQGLVPLDSLPEGWSEFFDEANRETEGLLTSWMKKDEIPQLTRLVRDTTSSACEWATSKTGPPGPQILVLVARIIHECIKTGAADVLEEHLTSVLSIAWKIFKADFRASWRTKIFVLQRLKRIWRAINEGEVLDLLYDLAELLDIHEALANLDDYTLFKPLRPGPQTPSWALDNLSLTQKYPKATVFVTTQQLLPPHTRIALFFTQIAIFVLPFLLFIVAATLNGLSMRYNNSFIVIATYQAETVFPSGWVFLDGKGRPHPNILRGLQAAWELVLFRARHWFWYSLVAQEPLILSINSKPASAVGIPSLLDCMKKNRLFPIYWLSLKPEDVATPVPCYAAMGETMTKWKNGDLPRNAWGDGWWELREEGGYKWKRVNVTEYPTWNDYSIASRMIKKHLLAKDREDVHSQFLAIRDYFLKTPSQQLIAMKKLFRDEHPECFAIWQGLFVDESGPKPKPFKRRNKIGWLERIIAELQLDRIRDQIVFTWDKGLLDEEGRPLETLSREEFWEYTFNS